jgi:ribonucleoside-triphosphate reductase (formate)
MSTTISANPTLRTILKRGGKQAPFDSAKICAAISRAGEATGEYSLETAQMLTTRVVNLALQMSSHTTPTVEWIQDLVEEVLLSTPYRKTAKAYILYREQHHRMREFATHFNIQLVDQYLQQADWRVNENSNMSFSLQGLNNYIAAEISKNYWVNEIYPKEICAAHQQGEFHIHDLGLLSVYCVGWDLQDLLQEGFTGAIGKVQSSPAKHFRSALGQIVNFFFTLQGESAGAQAFSSFDTLLAPFIRHDRLGYKEVKQALQEFVFNLNVPTRVGFQSPFTNLTLDLTVPKHLAQSAVVIGGKLQESCYGDYQNEMDTLNHALLEVLLEGDAKGRVFSFPIPTYNITKDFDWENPNMDLLWKVTGKYGIPYFSNFINSDMNPEDTRSMCCRLRIDNRNLNKRGGGLFGANPLTGSIGVVTINMARLGYTCQNEAELMHKLAHLMDLARNSLELKRKVLEKFTSQNLYPYLRFYLRKVYERFGNYLQNHFSTIGLIGVNECCLNLLGVAIGDPQGSALANRIMDFMREKLQQYQLETGHLYNLEATPAEGTSYRLAQIDKKEFPEIIVANNNEHAQGAAPFYTNSTHLPVNYTDDIFELLDLQDELQTKYTGGTVTHVFLGEQISDFTLVRSLVRKICENYHLPYFTFSPTFSVCPEHGYLNGEHKHCPQCGSEAEIYSRIVGYLRPVQLWNVGKKAEYTLRNTYKQSLIAAPTPQACPC